MEPFSFFSFTPIGLLMLVVGIGYMQIVGRTLLPKGAHQVKGRSIRPTLKDLTDRYGIGRRVHRVQLTSASKLAGRTVAEALLRTRYGVTVVGIERHTRYANSVMPALADSEVVAGDILYVVSTEPQLLTFIDTEGLERLPIQESQATQVAAELGVAEVMLPPASELIGRTLKEAEFRSRHGVSVLAIQRKGEPIEGNLIDKRLACGDSLLVGGGWEQIRLLRGDPKDFLLLDLPAELQEVAPTRRRAPAALLILLAMLVLMTSEVVPAVTAVLLAALAMVLSRCLTMDEAYTAINWQSLVLIAGMLPMATALEKTGGVTLIVNALVDGLGDFGPFALMIGLFVLTSLLSQFISNTATTVLVAPIAVGAATQLGVSPYAFLMVVAAAASTAFATPVASPTNTLVLGPGRYGFNDFVKVGVPLVFLSMVVALVAVPLFFPLEAGLPNH